MSSRRPSGELYGGPEIASIESPPAESPFQRSSTEAHQCEPSARLEEAQHGTSVENACGSLAGDGALVLEPGRPVSGSPVRFGRLLRVQSLSRPRRNRS